MTAPYRRRRIGELLKRYKPVKLNETLHRVLDSETSQLVDGAAYETAELARVKCTDLAVANIEALYTPDRARAQARIATIIGEQSDPQWAAQLILEYLEGAKK